jgi:drug/metabolite transporter (DMT)-like permease
MGLDGQGDLQAGFAVDTLVASSSSLTQGDVLIILAAVAYTFHCIRLGRYAKETSAVKLAACKATTETALSLALVFGLVAYAGSAVDPRGGMLSYAAEEGKDISNFVTFMSEGISSGSVSQSMLRPAIGAVLWTGWIPCAYTIYAQSFGQSRVSPTDANLIYTVQPIFTAIFAWGLLGETLGPAGYLGGALIGTAVYLVAVSGENDEERHDDEINGSSEDTLDEGKILVDVNSSE